MFPKGLNLLYFKEVVLVAVTLQEQLRTINDPFLLSSCPIGKQERYIHLFFFFFFRSSKLANSVRVKRRFTVLRTEGKSTLLYSGMGRWRKKKDNG